MSSGAAHPSRRRWRPRRLPAVPIALLLAATAATAQTPPAVDPAAPLPGYWELTETWVFVFHFTKVERKCFSAADVAGVMQGPSNAHYTCTYPTRQVGDGHLRLKGSCVEKRGQVANIAAEGTYEPTAFRLQAHLSTRIAGVPLSGTGSTTARRLSEACPSLAQNPGGRGPGR